MTSSTRYFFRAAKDTRRNSGVLITQFSFNKSSMSPARKVKKIQLGEIKFNATVPTIILKINKGHRALEN